MVDMCNNTLRVGWMVVHATLEICCHSASDVRCSPSQLVVLYCYDNCSSWVVGPSLIGVQWNKLLELLCSEHC